jgi:hypothetical protein
MSFDPMPPQGSLALHEMLEAARRQAEIPRIMDPYADYVAATRRMAEEALEAMRDPSERILEDIAENTANLVADAEARSAQQCVEQIHELIEQLEANLPNEVEVVVAVLSAGGETVCRVSTLGYAAPSLIVFHGVDMNGVPMMLVQQVGQINYALRIVQRLKPEEPRRRMGFHAFGRSPE